jgi:hypothetical protein
MIVLPLSLLIFILPSLPPTLYPSLLLSLSSFALYYLIRTFLKKKLRSQRPSFLFFETGSLYVTQAGLMFLLPQSPKC